MKKEELYAILGEVDEKYLVEGKQPYSKKTLFLKWGSLVAGFTVIVVTALEILPSYFNEKGCQKQDTFDVKIHVPSGSTEEYVSNRKRVCGNKRKQSVPAGSLLCGI